MGIYAVATAVGGLAWAAVHWRFGGGVTLIGASAAVYALVVIFACFFPQRELRFWMFFVVPVTLKPRHIIYVLAGFDMLGLLAFEIPRANLPFDMTFANSAHLGGMVTGFLYYRFIHEARRLTERPHQTDPELSRPVEQSQKPTPVPAADQIGVSAARVDIRGEVDRILDKINSLGFAALTPEERRLLDEAKDVISRP